MEIKKRSKTFLSLSLVNENQETIKTFSDFLSFFSPLMQGNQQMFANHLQSLKLVNGNQETFENISKLVCRVWESRNNQNVFKTFFFSDEEGINKRSQNIYKLEVGEWKSRNVRKHF